MIQLRAQFVLANRAEIEAEIERLIAMLDAEDAPDEDLEPEPDDGCVAGDDGFHPIVRNGVAFWGPVDGIYPTPPRYGEDQSLGPINERAARREYHRRMMQH